MSGDLAALVGTLDPAGPANRPWRHQGSLLLWAVDRAALGMPRLAAWREVREQLRGLPVVLGHSGSRGTPEYPFVALARTRWWELAGFTTPPPAAHSSAPRKSGTITTSPDDLALVCANCHRMLHRGPLLTPGELRGLFSGRTRG